MGSPVNVITANKKAKNLLYNGAFGLFQRGTSYTNTANTFSYTTDRWGFFPGAVSNYTLARTQHSNPGYALGHGRNALLVQRNVGNTAVTGFQFQQSLERRDSQVLIGKQVTLSFTAYKGANYSAAGSILACQILYTLSNPDTNYLTGWSAPVVAISQNNVLTTQPQRFSATVTLPTSNIVGVAVNFRFDTVGTAGAADLYVLEDVMLEEGPVATTFETRGQTFAEELQLCQRYYEKSYNIDVTPGTASNQGSKGFSLGAGMLLQSIGLVYNVRKRATPSIVMYDELGASGKVSRFSANGENASTSRSSETGFEGGNAGTVDRALYFQFTADAEI
jgi:hypothetical protein